MSWRQRLLLGSTGVVLALTGSLAQAGPYSSMYVFGDSLSDVGNVLNITGQVTPSPAYFTDGSNPGRFSNGLNYADQLASSFGLSLTPSTLGGTNYAYGGARATYVRPELVPYGALSFNAQFADYLGDSGGTADPNALYVLWIGANDMSDAVGQALIAGGNPAPIIGNAVNASITSLMTAFGKLESLGARHFVVGNVPNLGLTPLVRTTASQIGAAQSGGDPALAAAIAGQISGLATAASKAFNDALAFYLPANTAPGVSVATIDAFGLLNDVTANPSAYGLTNVTAACFDGQVDGSPSPGHAAVTVCANPDEYIYFDSEHPTARAHQILAASVSAQLVPEPAPWMLSMTALGLLGFMGRRRTRS